jgi:DNA-binding Lrp family transcriptional regulator
VDPVDKELLNQLQSGLPLVSRPFKALGEVLKQDEEWVLERIKELREEKIIRRLGGVFDSKNLGFSSTLIALKVPPDNIDQVAGIINSYPGVTHNYLREHEYNIWFTLASPSAPELESTLQEILRKTGVTEYLNLPTKKVFKINVEFSL